MITLRNTLVITYIFLTSVVLVLVLNKMVLVLVIESRGAIEHEYEHRLPTEHEHEFTSKSVTSYATGAEM